MNDSKEEKKLDAQLDTLYGVTSCLDCPFLSYKDGEYRCVIEIGRCFLDEAKDYLEEVRALRKETALQETVIDELLEVIKRHGIDLETEP